LKPTQKKEDEIVHTAVYFDGATVELSTASSTGFLPEQNTTT